MMTSATDERAFSLLEAIIALAILAAASTVILQRTSGLLDYAARAKTHYRAASTLLSRAGDAQDINLQMVRLERGRDQIDVHALAGDALLFTLRNYAKRGVVAPISEGSGPWQTQAFTEGQRHRLVLLIPSIPLPSR